MWRYFRESGPRRNDISEELYTMEIHHGGYFDSMPDGTMKYKLAPFNKDGGKIWLDSQDRDKIAWTEFGNIAWDLGYREKPISYYFKLPRTLCHEGWMPVRIDGDALEMVKLIPWRTKQISIYITGGGKRRKKEAEDDDLRPNDPDWENPLNMMTAAEKANVLKDANYFGSRLNRPSVGGYGSGRVNASGEGVNVGGEGSKHLRGVNGVINLDSDNDVVLRVGEQHARQSTFNGLTDLDPSLFDSQGEGIQSLMVQGLIEHRVRSMGQNQQTEEASSKHPSKNRRFSEAEKGAAFKKKRRKTKEARYNTRSKGEKIYEFEEYSDSSSEGSEFYIDSDYDPADSEDDVHFEENVFGPRVVEEFEEMGFGGECSEDGGESDELESLNGSGTEEDEEGNPLPLPTWRGIKLKSWNRRVDLKNPQFVVGHVFANSEVLKEAISECVLVTRRGLWFEKNSKKKIEVKCQLGCPFWLYASNIEELGPSNLVIKTLKPEHKCAHLTQSHHLTYHRIAKEVQEDLLVDEQWSRKGMQNHIQKKFNLDVSIQKIARGRAKAKRMNEGHYIEQYNMLASYRKELLRSNPGSTVEIKTQMVGNVRRFHRMYICLAACKQGWIEGCRPLIGLDGCHIKGQHPGQLLCAVGVDGNNGMFPIAYAIVEIENRETWIWFLEYLMWDLQMESSSSCTFITDKQKGLRQAIAELFPYAEHRHCVRHLYNNFKTNHPGEGLKQLVWDAARSSTRVWFNKHMDELKTLDDMAWSWFQDKSPEQWSRAYFRETSKCDLLLNNLCESYNAAIVPVRDKPIITMLEKMRMDLMVRMANRRVAAQNWGDMVGPRIKKIIGKELEMTSCYRAWNSGEFEFQITGGGDNGSKHAVDLRLHICTCRRWQLSGIPCVHALCAIRSKGLESALFVDEYLMPSTYLASYNPIIHPIAGHDDWDQVDYPIAPPPYKKQAGRPKMKRNKEPGEKSKPPPAPIDKSKMPRTYTKMTCQVCFKKGHNRLGCPITKAKKAAAAPQEGEGSSKATQQTKKRQRQQAPKIPGNSKLKEQIIKSKKGWKKAKMMEGNQAASSRAFNLQTVREPPTQTSQNPATKKAQQKTSQPQSEFAAF